MTHEPARASLPRMAIVFFVLCFAAVIYFLYEVYAPFLSALVWASVLTIVFYPLYRRILAVVRGRRTAAAFVTCVLILILIIVPFTILGVMITQQGIAFYQSLHMEGGSPADITAKLHELQSVPAVQRLMKLAADWTGSSAIDLDQVLRETAGGVSRFLVDTGPSLLRNVGGMILNFFLIFLAMFFLLRDGPQLIDVIKAASPLPDAIEEELFRKVEDVSYATFYGSLLTAAAQGAAAGLLFWALRLSEPLFWGAVVSLVALVPLIGAFLVWLPWAAYLLASGQTVRGVLLLAIGGLVVSSIDNVLKPIIIKGRTDLHPLLVFLSVLGGLQAFGFIGVLIGPLMTGLFISFLNFYRAEFRQNLHYKQSAQAQNRSEPG